MAEIIEKFNLSPIMPRSVQYADVAILHDEKEQVMGVAPADWNIPYPPLGVKIQGFQPKDAKKLFLLRYRELTPCQ